jgi:hypothetical protein
MSIAALIAWVVTAGGGFVLLGTWLARGGRRNSRLPSPVVFGHFAVAAVGLVLWIVYLVADTPMLAWIAFALLVVVALLGFTMFARWVPSHQSRATAAGGDAPAERHFPVVVVGAHGLVAVATVVLVLLAALSA